MTYLSIDSLHVSQIEDLKFANYNMSGAKRRAFQSAMALKYCGGSARLAEKVFGWWRKTVQLGLNEQRTNIVCLGAQAVNSGRLLWEEKHPKIAQALFALAESQCQQDPTFHSTLSYTRLTAVEALKQLGTQNFQKEHLPSHSTMAKILNRNGYRLRKVVKAKPQKKIPGTDAIFANIKKKDGILLMDKCSYEDVTSCNPVVTKDLQKPSKQINTQQLIDGSCILNSFENPRITIELQKPSGKIKHASQLMDGLYILNSSSDLIDSVVSGNLKTKKEELIDKSIVSFKKPKITRQQLISRLNSIKSADYINTSIDTDKLFNKDTCSVKNETIINELQESSTQIAHKNHASQLTDGCYVLNSTLDSVVCDNLKTDNNIKIGKMQSLLCGETKDDMNINDCCTPQVIEHVQVKRLSIDCKATVNIGNYSRGGKTRGNNDADDHDMGCKEKYVPFGILDEDNKQLHLNFGCSFKTSDFIVDSLEDWWKGISEQERVSITHIQIKVDNGPESSGIRTQFLKRMVQFADLTRKAIQLLYYPPYHSKYNPIERCWGILEQHWNGSKLVNAEIMLEWAKSMTWKGIKPTVKMNRKVYRKGISISKKSMKEVEIRLKRNQLLPKWDILIQPA